MHNLCVKVFNPLTSTLGEDPHDVLPAIRAILISELVLTPLLRLLDIYGNLQRHVLAPRAPTQFEMNLNFLGTSYRLGERFTVRTTGISAGPHQPTELMRLLPPAMPQGIDQCFTRVFLLQQSPSFCFFLWLCNFVGAILH